MFYIGIVNFGDLLIKGHSGCWDTDDFKALSVDLPLSHGLLEGSGIGLYYTIIFSFTFFLHHSML